MPFRNITVRNRLNRNNTHSSSSGRRRLNRNNTQSSSSGRRRLNRNNTHGSSSGRRRLNRNNTHSSSSGMRRLNRNNTHSSSGRRRLNRNNTHSSSSGRRRLNRNNTHSSSSGRHSGRAQEQRVYEQRQQHPQERQRVWQEHRAGNWQSDHRNWQQRGGYNGYQIPQERYHGYFGVNHGFRIGGLPLTVVGGFPRFQYGGYWFSMIDPWPGEWADDWYDSDDVYVDYMDGGYYLFDRMHPGVGIAISVSM